MDHVTKTMTFVPAEPPKTHDDRVEYEAKWEHEIEQAFGDDEDETELIELTLTNPYFSSGAAMSYEAEVRHLIQFQQVCLQCFAEDSPQIGLFRSAWPRIAADVRAAHILRGICDALTDDRAMRFTRLFCPETTLAHLSANGGAAFVSLADTLVRSGKTMPLKEPIYFPNPVVDALFERHAATPVMRQKLRVCRADYLSRIIWKTLRAFFDLPNDELLIKNQRLEEDDIAMLAKNFDSEEIAELRKEQHAYCRDKCDACFQCGALEEDLPAGSKLQMCTGCKRIGRKIMYCSRECQKADWRSGVPTPHRKLCGKKVGGEIVCGGKDAE
ncbi:zinc finger MYND domain-containing protein [Phanerochaete sordida]|uniref:Zinc finger MYND domain-containing protein n=1 Tax=Phanerochaete sordida TaxID=48140 RepID=A0A9P3LA98_9APHY|nr:zinc finger MYND domain-containing protein [Phanerochaete sordida]